MADWADDGASNPIPRMEVVKGPDGVSTITEYGMSEDGFLSKTVKVVKISQIERTVSKAVAARKNWTKFGDCAGKPVGLERGISTVSVDEIFMEWVEHRDEEENEEEEADLRAQAANDIQSMLKMERFKRRADERKKGVANWAQLMSLEASQRNPDGGAPVPGMRAGDGGGGAPDGKYVPPSKRSGAAGSALMGDSMYGRDDSTTVRVSNLSKATLEADLEELCHPFGETRRIFLSRDRDTGESKGFAFVTFREKRDAEQAISKLNGFGVCFVFMWPWVSFLFPVLLTGSANNTMRYSLLFFYRNCAPSHNSTTILFCLSNGANHASPRRAMYPGVRSVRYTYYVLRTCAAAGPRSKCHCVFGKCYFDVGSSRSSSCKWTLSDQFFPPRRHELNYLPH